MAKKKYKYPSPTTAEMVTLAMKKHEASREDVSRALDLEEGGLSRWFQGRRKPPSPAFCNGFKELFTLLPSIDKKAFLETWEEEYKLPPIKPYNPKEKEVQHVDR